MVIFQVSDEHALSAEKFCSFLYGTVASDVARLIDLIET